MEVTWLLYGFTLQDKIKQKRDDLKAKLIDEAPEGTPFDSIEVPLESEFQIMAEDLGRKGRTIRGLGSFSSDAEIHIYSCFLFWAFYGLVD